MAGGLDIVSPIIARRPGTLRLGINYEAQARGGYSRVGGYERFSGQPRPSDATYLLLELSAATSALTVGSTLTGGTSGATGEVFLTYGSNVALTNTSGSFVDGETVVSSLGPTFTVTDADAAPDSALQDNTLSATAANLVRGSIGPVPGAGQVRGLAVYNDRVYAWRDSADGSRCNIYASSSTGWRLVPAPRLISFELASVEPVIGSTITQGGATAVVRRVALQDGDYGAGDARGYVVVDTITGVWGAGLAAGLGTVPAAGPGVYHASAYLMATGGRVRHDRSNIQGVAGDDRLYFCDGVSGEFEMDRNEVITPLPTNMAPYKASHVRVFKKHVFFAFDGSLQHSSIGDQYSFSPVTGAAEIATGSRITNLVPVGGSEDRAAMMVLGRNSASVLYGNSAADWNLVPLSDVSGAREDAAHDIGGVVALDAPGVVRYPATQAFGNFQWSVVSAQIDPIAKGQSAYCSIYIPSESRLRIFLTDDSVLSGVAVDDREFWWTTLEYGVAVRVADHGEIDGRPRTFMGDSNGFVFECDVGRSFDGWTVESVLQPNLLSQKSRMVRKNYRYLEPDIEPASAFQMRTVCEFIDGSIGADSAVPATITSLGQGFFFGISQLDKAYLDVDSQGRTRVPARGNGASIRITMITESDNELPHKINSILVVYTPRRMVRGF